jgi:hypothetical protein
MRHEIGAAIAAKCALLRWGRLRQRRVERDEQKDTGGQSGLTNTDAN